MRDQDLQLISNLGRALYANPNQARECSLETLAALSTIERLDEDQSFERATQMMLYRAERSGTQATAAGVHHPFYRLSPIERFTLSLLHSGQVTYSRLARLLRTENADIERVAWHARMKIGSAPEVKASAPYPPGTSKLHHACPDYDIERPWTQRLLDDELTPKELLFFQNHTTACFQCQRSLREARGFYYQVEKWVPLADAEAFTPRDYERMVREAQLRRGEFPKDLSAGEAIALFLSRKETLVFLAIVLGAVALLAKMRG